MARLIGTYIDSGSFRRVSVEEARAGRYLVREERLAQPGVVADSCVIASCDDIAQAVDEGELRVLSHGGQMWTDARAMTCSRVPGGLARALFSPDGIGRFLHVPARPLAG